MNETTLNGQSADIVSENIQKLKQIFPEVFCENSIDFKKLQAVLGEYTDDDKERYNFTWWGKGKALRLAQTPSMGTLRPCKEESKNWDTTENLYIEGDNLEVLKLLQKSYHRKVKMIYIDPPYNTGNDFVYKDNYKDPLKSYLEMTDQVDGERKKISTNSETSGRYHTNWLNMMYPRLRLARNLLKDDGAIFISINDKEVENLKKICNEIFGEENILVQFCWKTDGNFDNQAKFKKCHEYILVYSKYENLFLPPPVIDPNIPENSKLFNEQIRNTIVKNGAKNPISKVTLPIGFPVDFEEGIIRKQNNSWPHYLQDAVIKKFKLVNHVEVRSGWSSKNLLTDFVNNHCEDIFDQKNQKSRFIIAESGAIEVVKDRSVQQSHVVSVLQNFGGPQKASSDLDDIGVIFDDYPKPLALIKYLLQMINLENQVILDFFSGSATTAHAIMSLNSSGGKKRKYIMVQLPELLDNTKERREKHKREVNFCDSINKPRTITEIAKEHIRRAGEKIKAELREKQNEQQSMLEEDKTVDPESLDVGFKVFKLDSSNLKKWNPDASNLEASLLDSIENYVEGRSELDVVFEIMLKYGIDLTFPIEEVEIGGKKIYSVGYGALMICLDREITTEVANEIVRLKETLKPEVLRVVFKDNGFADDSVKTNTKEILRNAGIDEIVSV